MQTKNWKTTFEPSGSWLSLEHGGAQIRVSGTLSLEMAVDGWWLDTSQDGVPDRFTLRNPKGEVQGYFVFVEDGGRLEMRVLHRTAQSFAGKLNFNGIVQMAGAFACRTRAPQDIRVVQMASGAADSPFNDSLFAPETDTCLLFENRADFRLSTISDGEFNLRFALDIRNASRSLFSFNILENFYRKRHVPYYSPIDRRRCPKAPTGWLSWNVYFDQAGAKENLDEARIGAEKLLPYGLEFWSIESWQDNSDHLPVAKFDNLSGRPYAAQFPEGMKWLADEIRALGFRPGIWVAPFGTGSQEFHDAHKEWFLHDSDGNPIPSWNGRYTIDPTNPEVRDHLRGLFRRFAEEWGYEFFKIDGMSGRNCGYCAHLFEMENVRAAFMEPSCPNPFELCAKAFREGIGPSSVFLACQGHYTGPDALVADASRSGADIVSPDEPSTWNNILSQANATLNQLFVHNIVFYLDPDSLLVGTYRSIEEARVTATIVSLPGQMMFAGDKLAELPPERMRLLQQTLPVCDIHPMDLYPIFDLVQIWDLKIVRPFGKWDVVALFNWSDSEEEVVCDFAEIGLDTSRFHAVYEFWTQAYKGIYNKVYSMVVPAHGVRLLSIHEARGVPQFLSTNRHVTQGGVEIKCMEWNAKGMALEGVASLVANDAAAIHVLVPDGYSMKRVESNAEISAHAADDGILTVSMLSGTSRDASFRVLF